MSNYDFDNCATRTNRNGPYVKEDVLAAIHESSANYAQMARLLGRKRTAVRDYVLSHADVKAEFEDVREGLVDDCEAMVFQQARDGDGPQLRFVLSTLGKNRGYSTRTEHGGINGGPIRIISDAMSLEEAAEAYADTVRG